MRKITAPARRQTALSRDRIVETAIALLDAHGESGLTFQSLSKRLRTGPGAIYWHVAHKNDLLIAACDTVIVPAFNSLPVEATPQLMIRAAASALFDLIDDHPWVGSVMIRFPGRMPMVRVLEFFGQQVSALQAPPSDQWAQVSTLLMFVLGVAGQNAANAQLAREMNLDRSNFIADTSGAWSLLAEKDYPFTRRMAERLRVHDDREDFLAGVDLIIQGAISSAQR